MFKIVRITGREILDSRGNRTVDAEVTGRGPHRDGLGMPKGAGRQI